MYNPLLPYIILLQKRCSHALPRHEKRFYCCQQHAFAFGRACICVVDLFVRCSRKYAPGINPAFAIIAALLEKRPEKRAALNDRYF
jgi:hypothetical protein